MEKEDSLSSGCYKKYHRLGAFEATDISLLQVWKLEVRDHGASGVVFQWGPASGVHTADFSLSPPMRARELSGVSLIRAQSHS